MQHLHYAAGHSSAQALTLITFSITLISRLIHEWVIFYIELIKYYLKSHFWQHRFWNHEVTGTQTFPIAAHAQSSIPTWFTLPLMCAAESNDYVPELVLNSIWQGMERPLLKQLLLCHTLAATAMDATLWTHSIKFIGLLNSQCMVLHNICQPITSCCRESCFHSVRLRKKKKQLTFGRQQEKKKFWWGIKLQRLASAFLFFFFSQKEDKEKWGSGCQYYLYISVGTVYV